MNKILNTLILSSIIPLWVQAYDFNKDLNFWNEYFSRDARKIISKWQDYEAYIRTIQYNISDNKFFINPCLRYEWLKDKNFWIQRFCSKVYTENWKIKHKTDFENKFVFEDIHTELRIGIDLEKDFHPDFKIKYTQIRIYLDKEFEKLYLNIKYNHNDGSLYFWLEFRFKKFMY